MKKAAWFCTKVDKHRLSEDETTRYIKRARRGNRAARDLIVQDNIFLVIKIAGELNKIYRYKGEFEDLVQEGSIGIIKAISTFDLSRNIKFMSYAHYWVRAEIIRFIINNTKIIKIGTTQTERALFFKGKMINEILRLPLPEREKEIAELAAAYNTTVDIIWSFIPRLNKASERSFSLELGDDIPSEKTIEECHCEEEEASFLLKAISTALNKNELYVINNRYLKDEKTLQEIGDELGFTRERIRQIETKALGKIKKQYQFLTWEKNNATTY